jgi:predicted nucleic acid-binding Zn ribbon protein
MIAEDAYADHIDTCRPGPPARPMNADNTKECIICSKQIDAADYVNHVNACLGQKLLQPKNTKECIICSKAIAETDYVTHVNKCVSGSSTSSKSTPTIKYNQNSCFTW